MIQEYRDIVLTPKQIILFNAVLDQNFKVRADNDYTEFYFMGGFGSGKSRIISKVVNDICLSYSNAHGAYIRGTFPELQDSVIPQYLSYFPQTENYYTYNKAYRTAEYTNGTRLDFRAFDKDIKILSNEYDFIAFSQIEEIQEELFLQSLGRNRRKIGGMPKNLILAEGNPSSGWLKKRLKDQPLRNNMLLVEARTCDNPYLPAGYEDNLRANYPAFWVARYLDGEWSNIDEAVFSEFREAINVKEPVGQDTIRLFKIRAGLDYGWVNPTAMVWGFVDYDGFVTIYDEWGATQQTPPEISIQAKRWGRIPIIADYSIKAKQSYGRSIWDDLSDAGLNLYESNKQELENITLANTLFKNKRLSITRNCVNLISEMRNYKWKKLKLGENKNRPEEPVDKDNHYIDAMLYLIASIEELKTPDPRHEEYKRSLEWANIQRERKVGYS
jgi:phage terminase large subunit